MCGIHCRWDGCDCLTHLFVVALEVPYGLDHITGFGWLTGAQAHARMIFARAAQRWQGNATPVVDSVVQTGIAEPKRRSNVRSLPLRA